MAGMAAAVLAAAATLVYAPAQPRSAATIEAWASRAIGGGRSDVHGERRTRPADAQAGVAIGRRGAQLDRLGLRDGANDPGAEVACEQRRTGGGGIRARSQPALSGVAQNQGCVKAHSG